MTSSSPTILLTRPAPAVQQFAERLRNADVAAQIVMSPLMRIESECVQVGADICGVLFTSKNGVASVVGRDLPAWCVGDATAQAAGQAGWQARSAGGDAEALYRRVLADAPKGPLLHVRGAHARGDLAERLTAAGIETREAVAYRQIAQPLSSEAKAVLNSDSRVLVPLFSPRTAESFVAEGPFNAPVEVIAISAAVKQVLQNAEFARIDVAAKPTADAMFSAILARLGAD